jgi:hypothetical protein
MWFVKREIIFFAKNFRRGLPPASRLAGIVGLSPFASGAVQGI